MTKNDFILTLEHATIKMKQMPDGGSIRFAKKDETLLTKEQKNHITFADIDTVHILKHCHCC